MMDHLRAVGGETKREHPHLSLVRDYYQRTEIYKQAKLSVAKI